MACRAHRRLICLLSALLFALGGVAHAYAATDAVMKMSAAGMETAGHDDGMGGMDCGGKDKAAQAACIAMCASAVAISNEPVAIPFVVAAQDVDSVPAALPSGLGLSPEPPPPKR